MHPFYELFDAKQKIVDCGLYAAKTKFTTVKKGT